MILGKSSSYKRLFKYKTKSFATLAEIPVCIWRKGKCIAKDESDMAYPEKSLQRRSVLERLLKGCLLHACNVGFDLPMGSLLLPEILDCRFAGNSQQGIQKSEDCVHSPLHHAIDRLVSPSAMEGDVCDLSTFGHPQPILICCFEICSKDWQKQEVSPLYDVSGDTASIHQCFLNSNMFVGT